MRADSAQRTPARETAALKLALTGLAGASIEWYDFFLYATAAALVFPTGVIFGGGLAPIIATGLFARFHDNFWIAAYMAGACALSLVCASRIGETSGMDLLSSVPAAGPLAMGSPTVT